MPTRRIRPLSAPMREAITRLHADPQTVANAPGGIRWNTARGLVTRGIARWRGERLHLTPYGRGLVSADGGVIADAVPVGAPVPVARRTVAADALRAGARVSVRVRVTDPERAHTEALIEHGARAGIRVGSRMLHDHTPVDVLGISGIERFHNALCVVAAFPSGKQIDDISSTWLSRFEFEDVDRAEVAAYKDAEIVNSARVFPAMSESDMIEYERVSYGAYVSTGIADTDGHFAPDTKGAYVTHLRRYALNVPNTTREILSPWWGRDLKASSDYDALRVGYPAYVDAVRAHTAQLAARQAATEGDTGGIIVWDPDTQRQARQFVGAVLGSYEQNLAHDSYFYAVVWDGEKVDTVEIGSTAYYGGAVRATPDATEAVLKAAQAWAEARYEAEILKAEQKRAGRIVKGARVRSLTTKGQNFGAEGVVMWTGPDGRRRNVTRVGFKVAGESKLRYLDDDRVEVVDAAPVDMAEVRQEARYRARERRWSAIARGDWHV